MDPFPPGGWFADFRELPLDCRYHFYADDLQIYAHANIRNLEACVASINKDIERICEWVDLNSLRLNETKTKAMIIGTPRQVRLFHVDVLLRVKIGDARWLPYVHTARNLGVRINSTLTWELHVRAVVSWINSIVYRLKLHRSCFQGR